MKTMKTAATTVSVLAVAFAGSITGAGAAFAAPAEEICGTFENVVVGDKIVQNNKWGTTEEQCTEPLPSGDGFTVTKAEGEAPTTSGAPKSYPSIFQGSHYGLVSEGWESPKVSEIPEDLRTSATITVPDGGWEGNASYDLWLDADPNPKGQATDTEIMLWPYTTKDAPQPIGTVVGTLDVEGKTWTAWQGKGAEGWDVVSYVADEKTLTPDVPVKDFVDDAVERGATEPDSHLTSVQVGFEPTKGGEGLGIEDFTLAEGGAPAGKEKAAAKRAVEDAAPSDELPATAPIKPGLPPEPGEASPSSDADEKEDTGTAKDGGDRKWWELWSSSDEDSSAAEEAGPDEGTDDGEPAQGKSPEQTRPTTSPGAQKEEKEKGTETRSSVADPDRAAGPSQASGYAEAALADDPVMLLTGETGGEAMADVVDPDREVTAHGSSAPATTPDGGAGVDLDGRSGYLEVDGEDLSIAGTGELTVEILMRPDKVKDLAATEGSSEGPIVHVLSKGSEFGDDGDQEWATRVYDEDSKRPGRISGYAFNPQGGEGAGSYDQSGLEEEEWTVATAVYDTTEKGEDGWGTVTMYRDGEKVDTDSLGGKYQVTPEDGGSPLFVGGGSGDDRFDGAIGAVAVYPTAQSGEEIAARADVALSSDADAEAGKDTGKSTGDGADRAEAGKDTGKSTGKDENAAEAGKDTGKGTSRPVTSPTEPTPSATGTGAGKEVATS